MAQLDPIGYGAGKRHTVLGPDESLKVKKSGSAHGVLTHTSTLAWALVFRRTKRHKIMTKPILYKSYGEILFQTVASGHLLPFLHKGSSKNVFKVVCFRKMPKT